MATPTIKTKHPGIYKRGSRYMIAYRANGKQRYESFRTLDEARRAKAARTTDIERGEFEERSRVTLHEYSLEWVGVTRAAAGGGSGRGRARTIAGSSSSTCSRTSPSGHG
jgi:hypothetical protein